MEVAECVTVYVYESPPQTTEESMVTLINMLIYSMMSLMMVNLVSSIGEMFEGG